MENLMRIREPLAWAMVALAGLSLVYQIVQIAWYLLEGITFSWYTVDGGSPAGVITVSWVLSWQGVDYPLTLGLAVAVLGCWAAPAVARARAITLTAAWIATLTVAIPVVVVVVALLAWPAPATTSPWDWWAPLDLLRSLITLGVGVVAAVVLWTLASRAEGENEADEPLDDPNDSEQVDEGPDEQPTVWRPDEATGAVWRTADEAAAGAPGARSLESAGADPAGAEWAQDAPRPGSASTDGWRPPAGS